MGKVNQTTHSPSAAEWLCVEMAAKSVVGSATWLATALKRLPDAVKVTKVNGKWHKPEFSALKLARIRQAGGGDAVDAALLEAKPPKGRKCDREKPLRLEKIETLLARQPEFHKKIVEVRVAQATEKFKKKNMGNVVI